MAISLGIVCVWHMSDCGGALWRPFALELPFHSGAQLSQLLPERESREQREQREIVWGLAISFGTSDRGL